MMLEAPRDTLAYDKNGLIRPPTPDELDAMLRARKTADQARYAKVMAERNAHKRSTRLRIGRGVLAATLAYLSVKGGGAVDMVHDFSTQARTVAESAIPDPHQYLSDDDPSLPEAIRARNEVIKLIDRVDREGYGGIRQEVDEERANDINNYPSDEFIEESRHTIDNSATPQEVAEALNAFMQFYGVSASLAQERQFNGEGPRESKKIAEAYIEVFSNLPKKLIDQSGLKEVTISMGPQSSMKDDWATYHKAENRINIVQIDWLKRVAVSASNYLDGSSFSYPAAVAHELGHALHYKAGGLINETWNTNFKPDKSDMITQLEQIGRNTIAYPDAPSIYGKTSSIERTAELISGVLTDRRGGLVSVDESRRFKSPLNRAILSVLASLEQQCPGIAKTLLADRVS